MSALRSAVSRSPTTSASDLPLLSPAQFAGLQSLLTKLYNKPVHLRLQPLRRPHLDADVLASVVSTRLRDRRAIPRRIIRDAAWKAQLPTPASLVALRQARQRAGVVVEGKVLERHSGYGAGVGGRTPTSRILAGLRLSRVSSVRVEAAGRLSKRITANRSQRKVARRGASGKGKGYMVRGFRKAHVGVAMREGKRRIGSYGVRVEVGHS